MGLPSGSKEFSTSMKRAAPCVPKMFQGAIRRLDNHSDGTSLPQHHQALGSPWRRRSLKVSAKALRPCNSCNVPNTSERPGADELLAAFVMRMGYRGQINSTIGRSFVGYSSPDPTPSHCGPFFR